MTWGWQEWAVALLIILCIIRMIYGICVFFRRTKNNENPCAGCVSGCDLKSQLEQKQQECKTTRKSSKKKCCK